MSKHNDVCIQLLKEQYLNYTTYRELSIKVMEQIGDDDHLFTYPEDYRDASGGVSGFIYYTDTVKFAKDNIFLIQKALNDFESECGLLEKPI